MLRPPRSASQAAAEAGRPGGGQRRQLLDRRWFMREAGRHVVAINGRPSKRPAHSDK